MLWGAQAISEAEAAVSLPLQTLCLAVFDATLVHVLNTVAPGRWFGLKQTICDALNRTKVAKILQIIESTYSDVDVLFLQEVAAVFPENARELAPQLAAR